MEPPAYRAPWFITRERSDDDSDEDSYSSESSSDDSDDYVEDDYVAADPLDGLGRFCVDSPRTDDSGDAGRRLRRSGAGRLLMPLVVRMTRMRTLHACIVVAALATLAIVCAGVFVSRTARVRRAATHDLAALRRMRSDYEDEYLAPFDAAALTPAQTTPEGWRVHAIARQDAPAAFVPPRLVLRSPVPVNRARACPPGAQGDGAGYCVERHAGGALAESGSADACADPYAYACGPWDAFYGAWGVLRRTLPREDEFYHAQMRSVARDALRDSDSALYAFARQGDALRTGTLPEPARALWESARPETREQSDALMRASVAAGLLVPAVLSADDGAPLCALYALLHRAGSVAMRALSDVSAALGARLPETELQLLIVALNDAVEGGIGSCTRTEVSQGILGSGLLMQADVRGSVHRDAPDRPGVRADSEHALWQLCALVSPLAAYYVGTDARTGEPHFRLRLALPSGALFDADHTVRLAMMALAETLEDRYTGVVTHSGRHARELLAGVSACLATRVELATEGAVARAAAAQCISAGERTRADLAITAQACSAARRVRPREPLLEAHVPAAVRVGGEIRISAAMLESRWTHLDRTRNLAATRLLFVLQRDVLGTPTQDTVRALLQCDMARPQALSRAYWADLVQADCGTARNSTRPAEWRSVLLEHPVYRRAFQCS